MIVTKLARKEITEMMRDGRFRWSAGVLLIFLAASLIVGIRQAIYVRHTHEKAQVEERERWLNKGETGSHTAMHFGQYIYKPYHPLSAIDGGIAQYVGAYSFIEAHRQNLFEDKPAEDEVPTRRIGEIAAGVCLQVLVPLLIVVLGFSSIVGEREQGTLRYLLSLGVSRKEILLGKVFGTAVPLMIILVPAALLGSLSILLSERGLVIDSVSRLLVMAAGYLFYFFTFFALTLCVSMLASTSRQALVILLSFWFAVCLMMSPLVSAIGGTLFPSPSSFDFQARIKREEGELLFKDYKGRVRAAEQEQMAKYNVSSVEDLPVNMNGIMLLADQKISDAIFRRAFFELYESYRKQNQFYQVAGLISPMLPIQSLSMGLAETDILAHQHFSEAVSRYHNLMETTMNGDMAYNTPPGSEINRGRELWEKVPPFSYERPTVSWVVFNYLMSCVLLVVWLLVSLLALRVAAAKMSV